MAHLKKSSITGHLLKNSSGHLVKGCDEVCTDPCTAGNCQFDSSSTITAEYKTWRCHYTDSSCSNFDFIVGWYWTASGLTPASSPNCLWEKAVTTTYYESSSGVCREPSEDDIYNTYADTGSVIYIGASNEWQIGCTGHTDFIPTSDSDCSGGFYFYDSSAYCLNKTKYFGRWTITVNNNHCENPLP